MAADLVIRQTLDPIRNTATEKLIFSGLSRYSYFINKFEWKTTPPGKLTLSDHLIGWFEFIKISFPWLWCKKKKKKKRKMKIRIYSVLLLSGIFQLRAHLKRLNFNSQTRIECLKKLFSRWEEFLFNKYSKQHCLFQRETNDSFTPKLKYVRKLFCLTRFRIIVFKEVSELMFVHFM